MTHEPVLDLIAQRLPNTLILVASSYSIILVVAIVAGVYTAVHQYSLVDQLVTTLAFVFLGYRKVKKLKAPERTISSLKETAAALKPRREPAS